MKFFVITCFFLLGGCVDRGLDATNTAPLDFSFHADFATNDLALPLDGSGNCMQIAGWSSDEGVTAFNENPSSSQGYAWDDYVEGFRTGNNADGGSDILYYEFYEPEDMSQPTTVPHALDFASQNEAIGLVLDFPIDGSSAGTNFIATSGNITISAIDDTQPSGTVSVHGSNVGLQETDANDELLPSGACIQIGSFDLSAMYDNSGGS